MIRIHVIAFGVAAIGRSRHALRSFQLISRWLALRRWRWQRKRSATHGFFTIS